MKVLQLVPPADTGGGIAAYGFLDEEMHALSGRGVQLFVISPTLSAPRTVDGVRVLPLPPGRSPEELLRTSAFVLRQRARIPRESLRPISSFVHAARIERFAADTIRREGIDLVHSHFGWPRGTGGLLAARAAGVPVVASFRGMDLFLNPEIDYGLRRDPAYDAAVRQLLRFADRTVYWGDSTRRIGLALGADPDGAVLLRKGVDTSRFHVVADRDVVLAELDLRPPMIFSAATLLIPRKGIDTALRALARLKDSHPFTYVVCGEGGQREELQRLANDLGLGDRVRFVGRLTRDEIASYFAACDMYLLASVVEAAGNVVLEAMASGRPVVCTDSGGPPEYVEHEVTGLVVPPRDPMRMAEAIGRLLDDADLRERLGTSARRTAESELPYSQMTDRVLAIYEEALVLNQWRSGTGGRGRLREAGRIPTF
jgi:glycosyltransferase involved in cell wall biosynthesis